MSYATIQNAKDLYGETYVLTSVAREDLADETAFTRALAKASSEMDTYLGTQRTVPVDPVPDVLVRYCVDIAIYIASADAGSVTEEKRKRYEDAMRWLRDVSRGDAVIPGQDEPAENNLPQTSGPARAFSRCTMRGL